MAGKLYLCATPIGNLDDITFRVLECLRNADVIAAEDARHTITLLNHFDIQKHLVSYHRRNEDDKIQNTDKSLNIILQRKEKDNSYYWYSGMLIVFAVALLPFARKEDNDASNKK